MQAVVQTRTGGPEVLEAQERPEPVLGEGDVRIAVRAAGVNFADTMARAGLYPPAPKPPCVLGYEVSGVVDGGRPGRHRGAGGPAGDGRHPVRRPGRDRRGARGRRAAAAGSAQLRAGCGVRGQLRHRVRGPARPRRDARGRPGAHPRRRPAGWASPRPSWPATPARRSSARRRRASTRRSARHGVQHPIDYRSTDFAVEVRRILGGQPPVPRPDHRRARPQHLPPGLPAAPDGRPAGDVRAVGGLRRTRPQPARAASEACCGCPRPPCRGGTRPGC